ncbi:hypothetical protein AZH51_01415 [Branchiibius sp. NY16-3462-2]|nr:hypothetical protein AZH51_01415 [Branchiibius sp. NY16-3462-2]
MFAIVSIQPATDKVCVEVDLPKHTVRAHHSLEVLDVITDHGKIDWATQQVLASAHSVDESCRPLVTEVSVVDQIAMNLMARERQKEKCDVVSRPWPFAVLASEVGSLVRYGPEVMRSAGKQHFAGPVDVLGATRVVYSDCAPHLLSEADLLRWLEMDENLIQSVDDYHASPITDAVDHRHDAVGSIARRQRAECGGQEPLESYSFVTLQLASNSLGSDVAQIEQEW